MDALRAEAGIRTPRVLPAADGRRIVTVTDTAFRRQSRRTATACGSSSCRAPSRPDRTAAPRPPAHFTELGEITARMHAHARAWDRPAWFTRFRWDDDAAFGPRPRWGRWQDGVGVGPAEAEILGRLERGCGSGWRRSGAARSRSGWSTPIPGWRTCWSMTGRRRSSTSTTRGSAGTCTTLAPRSASSRTTPPCPTWSPPGWTATGAGGAAARRGRRRDMDVHPVPAAAAGRLDRLAPGRGRRRGAWRGLHPRQLRPGREVPEWPAHEPRAFGHAMFTASNRRAVVVTGGTRASGRASPSCSPAMGRECSLPAGTEVAWRPPRRRAGAVALSKRTWPSRRTASGSPRPRRTGSAGSTCCAPTPESFPTRGWRTSPRRTSTTCSAPTSRARSCPCRRACRCWRAQAGAGSS